jgi:integrase
MDGKSRSPEAASPRTRRWPIAPARSGRSTSGCARPASRAGPSSARSTAGENVQKAALNLASVAWILKRALGRTGVGDLQRYGAHSLRAGFAATAFDTGVPEFKIRQQTGHKTSRMLEKYIRSEQKARQEAASSLGL